MLAFIVGLTLASLLFLSISLLKTYHHVPLRELKRQANQGDEISKLFYRVAAYEVSFDMLLWGFIGIVGGIFFVFLSHNFPWPVAVFGVVACVWFGFAWMPNSHITKPGFLAAKFLARPLAMLLEWLHTPLTKLSHGIGRFRPVTVHTGLYTKEDLIEFIELQRSQIDNRVHKKDLDLVVHTLLVSDKAVADVMTPWRRVKKVATHDMVGPVLMDELHKSGHTHFPVYQGGDKKDLVGILDIADMLDAKEGGFVKDIMTKRVYYLHETEKVSEAFTTIAKTKHPLFIVVDDKEDFVGVLSMTEVLQHMLGNLSGSDFNAHDNKTAVVAKHKPKLTKVDETVEITPDGEIASEKSEPEKEEKTETTEEK